MLKRMQRFIEIPFCLVWFGPGYMFDVEPLVKPENPYWPKKVEFGMLWN